MIDPDNLPEQPELLTKVLPAGGPLTGQKPEPKRCGCQGCAIWGKCWRASAPVEPTP